jgi:prepilin-type N-terminal cleavage/methylation domain-containing protein
MQAQGARGVDLLFSWRALWYSQGMQNSAPLNAPRTLQHAGFSLAEVSIVLVILGLLVGGIMTGSHLIKAANIRATINQMGEMSQLVNTFRDKYMYLPGDMPDAHDVWAEATPGNGDGLVGGGNSRNIFCPDDPNFTGERDDFFKHLGYAGMTTRYGGSGAPQIGRDYPAVKARRNMGMFVASTWTTQSGSNINTHLFATDPVYLFMGVCNPADFGSSSNFNDCGVFTPEEMWNIDSKVDDGKFNAGMIVAQSWSGGNPRVERWCARSGATDGEYNIRNVDSTVELTCNLLYSLR